MKKLALASVAFAGVTAFGAGDSFAAGFVGFTAGPSGFSHTDTTVWGPVGADSVAGAGSTASFTGHSVIKHIGVTASFPATSTTSTATLTVFNQNCAHGPNTICAGFKPNTHVLGDNAGLGGSSSIGSLSLAFDHKLSSIGFNLSPLASDWGATATFFSGSPGNYHKLGDVKLSGLPLCSGTTSTSPNCRTPAFVGATDTAGIITAVTLGLTGLGPMGIGTLYETLASTAKIPEPISLSVLGVGLLGLGAVRRRRHARDRADGSRWSPFGRWRVTDSPPDTKSPLR